MQASLVGELGLEEIGGLGLDPAQPHGLHVLVGRRLVAVDIGVLALVVFGILVEDDLVGTHFLVAHVAALLFQHLCAGLGEGTVVEGLLPSGPFREGAVVAMDRGGVLAVHQPGVALVVVALGAVPAGECLGGFFELTGAEQGDALPHGVLERLGGG